MGFKILRTKKMGLDGGLFAQSDYQAAGICGKQSRSWTVSSLSGIRGLQFRGTRGSCWDGQIKLDYIAGKLGDGIGASVI